MTRPHLTSGAESLRTTISVVLKIGDSTVISLAERDRQPELMDQPGLDEGVHHKALDGLARVNAISRTVNVLWRGLRTADAFSGTGPLRVLDIGAGGGDIVIGLARSARRHGITMEVDGCD